MRRSLAAALVVALAAAGLTALPAAGATKTIRLIDNKFRPASVTVPRGTTLRFVWAGKNPHNIFAVQGPLRFNSGTKVKGTYRKRVTRKGRYSLICTIHAGMTLTLRVR